MASHGLTHTFQKQSCGFDTAASICSESGTKVIWRTHCALKAYMLWWLSWLVFSSIKSFHLTPLRVVRGPTMGIAPHPEHWLPGCCCLNIWMCKFQKQYKNFIMLLLSGSKPRRRTPGTQSHRSAKWAPTPSLLTSHLLGGRWFAVAKPLAG